MVVVWFEAFEWCKGESSRWAEVSLYCTHAAEAGSFQAVISPDPRTDAKPEVAWWRTSLALIVCNFLPSSPYFFHTLGVQLPTDSMALEACQ